MRVSLSVPMRLMARVRLKVRVRVSTSAVLIDVFVPSGSLDNTLNELPGVN